MSTTKNMKHVIIRLEDEQHREFKSLVAENRTSMQAVLIQAVKEYLNK